jgi:hypothetical protein
MENARFNRRQWLAATATGLAAGNFSELAFCADAKKDAKATQVFPLADPSDFTLKYKPGAIVQGANRRVLYQPVQADDNVVANLLVEVGKTQIVMPPNGKLQTVAADQTTETDKPFVPATIPQLSAELTKQFAGFKSRNTKHYLYLYNCSELFHTGTSRILETMLPGILGYAKSQKMNVHPPELPLVVIMFHTEQEFQDFQVIPDGVVGYYSPISNYVVIYEVPRIAQFAPEIAMRQAISTIAHEGAHQVLHNIGVQQRMSHWPLWLGEGLAEYFAPTTTDKRMTWAGAGQLNGLRLMELDAYLRTRDPGSHGDLVRATVEAASLTSTGYAAAWALTHFLVTQKTKPFFDLLKEVSATGPLEGNPRPNARGQVVENLAAFAKHFGTDTSALEDQVVQHLQNLIRKMG